MAEWLLRQFGRLVSRLMRGFKSLSFRITVVFYIYYKVVGGNRHELKGARVVWRAVWSSKCLHDNYSSNPLREMCYLPIFSFFAPITFIYYKRVQFQVQRGPEKIRNGLNNFPV